jgi:uncharacterized membrane protein YgdD (TMEM256/DUF423 family)
MKTKHQYAVAASLGLLAIILGAFGAHALKKHLSIEQLTSFETGVRYQMYHAFFLLFVIQSQIISTKLKNTIFKIVLVGWFMFSGSIYLLSTMPISEINFKPIGFVTPLGGLLLIISWGMLIYGLLTFEKQANTL